MGGGKAASIAESDYPYRSPLSSQIIFPTSSNKTNRLGVAHHRLVYNRVPKCASSTMQVVLDLLSARNQFEYMSSADYYVSTSATPAEELAFLEDLMRRPEPYGVDRHFFYVDSARYGLPEELEPIWLNVVREPVERFASLFRYNRHPKRWGGPFKPPNVSAANCIWGVYIS